MQKTLLRIVYIYIFSFAILHHAQAQSDTTSVNKNQPQDLDEVVVISFKEGGQLTKLRSCAESLYPRLRIEIHFGGVYQGNRLATWQFCNRIVR